MIDKSINYIGTKVGHLKIIDIKTIPNKNNINRIWFECLCDCGNIFLGRAELIKRGATKSCGCMKGNMISGAKTLENNMGTINIIYSKYKDGAKRRNYKFELSIEEFKQIIFLPCVYCGAIPYTKNIKTGKKIGGRTISCNGIDRVDNTIGYIIENCVPCCEKCNVAKSTQTLNEFKTWLTNIAHNFLKIT